MARVKSSNYVTVPIKLARYRKEIRKLLCFNLDVAFTLRFEVTISLPCPAVTKAGDCASVQDSDHASATRWQLQDPIVGHRQ
jgi:hypothetical protein